MVTQVGQPTLTFCEASPSNQNVPWSTKRIHHQARNLPISNGVDVTTTVTTPIAPPWTGNWRQQWHLCRQRPW